jgi:hypothetical protein
VRAQLVEFLHHGNTQIRQTGEGRECDEGLIIRANSIESCIRTCPILYSAAVIIQAPSARAREGLETIAQGLSTYCKKCVDKPCQYL